MSTNGSRSGEPAASPLKLSTYRYATGWYCVAWADDIARGEVRKLHYFGQDLVCFRGEGGALSVLDPHCLHLGGHLGVGGKVKGDCIVCPWHGWHWNGDGSHALVPYSEQKHKPHLRIRSWPAREWYGMLLVWHDRHRRPPTWEPPRVPEAESDEFFSLHPHSRMLHRIKAHPQMIVENAADPYHVGPVHQGTATETTSFTTSGHHLHATIRNLYGEGKKSTWLTPNGPVDASITYDTYGLGIGFVRFPRETLETVQITSHTPVDDTYTDYWFMQASRRDPGETGDKPVGRSARFLAVQQNLVTQDFPLWENMCYLERPEFAPEEARDYTELRLWARKLYPPEEL